MVRTASGKLEVEDGEIEDAKMSDLPINVKTVPDPAQPVEPPPADVPTNPGAIPTAESAKASAVLRKNSPAPNTNQAARTLGAASSVSLRSDVNPTPALGSAYSPIPARPDMSRNVASGTANGRLPHDLPNKPELPQLRGDHRLPPRVSERGPQDHAREPRFPERGGLDRPRDLIRDKVSERSASGLHPQSHERAPQPIERERLDARYNNEKPPTSRANIDDRLGGVYPRDTRPLHREDRPQRPLNDRQFSDQHHSRRDAEISGQRIRDTEMPPPRSNIPQHPDRAALIHGNHAPDRSLSTSIPRDRHSESLGHDSHSHPERNSRGSSPVRGDDRRSHRYDNRRVDRPLMDEPRSIEEPTRFNQSRFDEPHAPTGPRTARPASAVFENPNDRARDLTKPSSMTPVDPNHGRLSNDSSYNNRQSESQYGRLNSGNDIPSGPRLPSGNQPPPVRGGRNISAPQPHINTQQPPSPSQTPLNGPSAQDRQAPSGPSLRASPRKPAPFPPPASTSSAPPTPVSQSPETAGIHPDRLKAIQGSGAAAGEHVPHAGLDQSRGLRQDPSPVSMTGPGPPRGPNNQLPSPVAQSPIGRGPPTGPSFPNDRNRDKRFADLQNMLQQAGTPLAPERSSQGASIRGRGGRANNVSMPSPTTTGPPVPNVPRQDGPPPRGDLFAGRPNGPPLVQQNEEDTGYGRGTRRGGGREDGDRRPSRNRSRSPGKDRPAGGPMRVREDDGRPGRDGMSERSQNDIRGGTAAADKSIRGGAVSERDLRDNGLSVRDMRRSGRDEDQYRERRVEDGRRDGRDRRDGGGNGGGSGRKRGRGGEDGQGERGFLDNKRTRR